MATNLIRGVRLAGVAAGVPEHVRTLEDDEAVFGADARKIAESTGVRARRVVQGTTCTSDLCHAAGDRLLDDLGWPRDSIDALIFVTQTPDYVLPATACSLHGRLGLARHCAAFDVNLGCSGYVYGLWLAAQLIACGQRRVLLLVGDTISRIVAPRDRSTVPLFGDAGTATALERDEAGSAGPMVFDLGSDGRGQDHLIVPAGGFRRPRSEQTALRSEQAGGNVRGDEDLFMDGAEIFTFTLREVPALVRSTLGAAGWSVDDVDAVVMHQANRFMLEHLAKRMKLPPDKVPLALEDYGNTSSASIPLTLIHSLADRLRAAPQRLLLAGFGVGFSWGAVALSCGPLVVPELMIVPDAIVPQGRSEACGC